MTFYLKEEFLSFDHFDIWDEQDQLVYSADREFFTFGKKLNVEDASGRQIAAIQHVPFSIPCTYVLTIEGQDYDLTRNFAFFSRSYSLDALGWEIEGDFMSLEYARPLRRPRHRLLRRGTQRLKPDRRNTARQTGSGGRCFLWEIRPGYGPVLLVYACFHLRQRRAFLRRLTMPEMMKNAATAAMATSVRMR